MIIPSVQNYLSWENVYKILSTISSDVRKLRQTSSPLLWHFERSLIFVGILGLRRSIGQHFTLFLKALRNQWPEGGVSTHRRKKLAKSNASWQIGNFENFFIPPSAFAHLLVTLSQDFYRLSVGISTDLTHLLKKCLHRVSVVAKLVLLKKVYLCAGYTWGH